MFKAKINKNETMFKKFCLVLINYQLFWKVEVFLWTPG